MAAAGTGTAAAAAAGGWAGLGLVAVVSGEGEKWGKTKLVVSGATTTHATYMFAELVKNIADQHNKQLLLTAVNNAHTFIICQNKHGIYNVLIPTTKENIFYMPTINPLTEVDFLAENKAGNILKWVQLNKRALIELIDLHLTEIETGVSPEKYISFFNADFLRDIFEWCLCKDWGGVELVHGGGRRKQTKKPKRRVKKRKQTKKPKRRVKKRKQTKRKKRKR